MNCEHRAREAGFDGGLGTTQTRSEAYKPPWAMKMKLSTTAIEYHIPFALKPKKSPPAL